MSDRSTDSYRLGPEVGCWPVWEWTLDGYENIDVSDKISAVTAKRLDAWNECFQTTYDVEYPPDGGFESLECVQRFNIEGSLLQELLTADLRAKVEFKPLSDDWVRSSDPA